MRTHFKRLCGLSGLLTAVVVVAVTSGARAQEGAATQAPPGAPDLAGRALGVLQSFCAECVDAGLGGALSLDDVARDPSLVIAKQPDASRVYQWLLDRPLDSGVPVSDDAAAA